MSGRLVKSLYRHLLILGKRIDANPSSKLLFYRKKASIATHTSALSVYYQCILDKIFTSNGNLFKPSKEDNFEFTALIMDEFRRIDKTINTTDRIDAGFVAVRKLSAIWKVYSAVHESIRNVQDWYGEKEKEISNENIIKEKKHNNINDEILNIKSTTTLDLQPGTLLVAHPLVQGPLHRTVVLLLEHNEQGSYGIVINRQTEHKVATAVKNLPTELVDVFGDHKVSFGGMVRRLQYIHDLPNCGGIPIPTCTKKMFAGGQVQKVVKFVKNGGDGDDDDNNDDDKVEVAKVSGISDQAINNINTQNRSQKFKFFVGCCTWDPEILNQEVSAGYWIPVTSQPDLLLDVGDRYYKYQQLRRERMKEGMNWNNKKLKNKIDDKSNDNDSNSSRKQLDNDDDDNNNDDNNNIKTVINKDKDKDEMSISELHLKLQKDVWIILLESLGGQFVNISKLPAWVIANSVESVDL